MFAAAGKVFERGGWPSLSSRITSRGALPLSRFLRQGGDFDFLTSMRMVENNAGGSYSQIVYGPTGAKVATANAGALIKAFVALPGGASAIYNSSGSWRISATPIGWAVRG
jgi:hypothetical protein